MHSHYNSRPDNHNIILHPVTPVAGLTVTTSYYDQSLINGLTVTTPYYGQLHQSQHHVMTGLTITTSYYDWPGNHNTIL